ncbi:vegetative cell wall protein gp1 [Xylaria sp. CBS 124048]|nr:vegetative cell wall protein gp1 [Xylaria sp. CBS 124048]
MSHYGSPYAGTPRRGDPYHSFEINSPSPTPSPQPFAGFSPNPGSRARGASTSHVHSSNPISPRYKSNGVYATGPTPKVSSRKHSFSHKGPKHHDYDYVPPHATARDRRRSSYSYYRTSYGDSDEDEFIKAGGYVFLVQPVGASKNSHHNEYHHYTDRRERTTDFHYSPQGMPTTFYKAEYTRYGTDEPPPLRSATRVGHHSRRPSSGAIPHIQRPSTARPAASVPKKSVTAPPPRATQADAEKHCIPAGYSLKNWDPTEEPIMLLGSVFDANSLGKWIYDWTVYHHGPATPISDMAGEMWLLLIQLSGKIKRSEEIAPQVRSKENREMLEDFIESGERLTDRLRSLLKRCEAPMLKASKKREAAQLGKNSGIEFVETLFGRERELEKTEQYMQQVHIWNLRFDANCEDILKRPTK